MQAVGQQLFLYQPTVELIFQLGNTQRRQFRRQQTQDIVTLMQPVNLLRHGRGFAHQHTEGFHGGIFARNGFCLTGSPKLFRQLLEFRLLGQEVTVLHDKSVIAALNLPGAHIP